jgi:hypothetical protein
MNANELADKLWENYFDNNECEHGFALSSGCHNDDCKEQALYDASTMLRQQQAEIKALKKSCLDEIFKRTYANQTAKVMQKYWQEAQAEIDTYKSQKNNQIDTYRYKNLTDKEIVEIYNDILIHDKKSSIKFARAILRKAQEK